MREFSSGKLKEAVSAGLKSRDGLTTVATAVVGKVVGSAPKHSDMIANVFGTEFDSGQLTKLCASLQESLNSEHQFQHSPRASEAFPDRARVMLHFKKLSLTYAHEFWSLGQ